jgi:signal transduction histidine kinase
VKPGGREVAKIYVGRLDLNDDMITALAAAGHEVIPEEPPKEPPAGDLALVAAREGITSTLRHEVLNAMTTVLGFTELLQRRMDLPEGVAPKLDRIREYGTRVKVLLRRHENARD